MNRIKEEIKNFSAHTLSKDPRISVTYEGWCTMVDLKVVNAVNDNPGAMNCCACHAKPTEMAKRNGNFVVNDRKSLDNGIPPCHFLIRTFEWIMKIGANRDFKKSRVGCPQDKVEREIRREEIHLACFERLGGLRVNEPRDGGAGTSNDGNTKGIFI
jgi:hypothetical protein